MTAKLQTKAQLAAALAAAVAQHDAQVTDLEARLGALRLERDSLLKAHDGLRKDLDDVKERLASADEERHRMRGYLDRVMEDDHAREELVTIGEPGGEQQLVPKRKHREQPHIAGRIQRNDGDVLFAESYRDAAIGREPRHRRHWVTY